MSEVKSASKPRRDCKPKAAMSRAQARAFKRRWRLVNADRIAELRATPAAARFQQMIAMTALLEDMGKSLPDGANENQARDRWIKLKDTYLGRTRKP